MDLFYQSDNSERCQSGPITVVSQTYEESFRDLIHDERHYLRELQMIIKVCQIFHHTNVCLKYKLMNQS